MSVAIRFCLGLSQLCDIPVNDIMIIILYTHNFNNKHSLRMCMHCSYRVQVCRHESVTSSSSAWPCSTFVWGHGWACCSSPPGTSLWPSPQSKIAVFIWVLIPFAALEVASLSVVVYRRYPESVSSSGVGLARWQLSYILCHFFPGAQHSTMNE